MPHKINKLMLHDSHLTYHTKIIHAMRQIWLAKKKKVNKIDFNLYLKYIYKLK
jgi:hypothetical protein